MAMKLSDELLAQWWDEQCNEAIHKAIVDSLMRGWGRLYINETGKVVPITFFEDDDKARNGDE